MRADLVLDSLHIHGVSVRVAHVYQQPGIQGGHYLLPKFERILRGQAQLSGPQLDAGTDTGDSEVWVGRTPNQKSASRWKRAVHRHGHTAKKTLDPRRPIVTSRLLNERGRTAGADEVHEVAERQLGGPGVPLALQKPNTVQHPMYMSGARDSERAAV
jgi:hypothetical protein